MNYDLTIKEDRRKFIRRANGLLKNKRNNVSLLDESTRTLNQNSYIHVLCRVLAADTGVTTDYAKQIYFKRFANPTLFIRTTKDKITNKPIVVYRSITELTITETRQAISNFLKWGADNGYYLPEAKLNDDGSMTFMTEKDRDAYHQALINTSKIDEIQ